MRRRKKLTAEQLAAVHTYSTCLCVMGKILEDLKDPCEASHTPSVIRVLEEIPAIEETLMTLLTGLRSEMVAKF